MKCKMLTVFLTLPALLRFSTGSKAFLHLITFNYCQANRLVLLIILTIIGHPFASAEKLSLEQVLNTTRKNFPAIKAAEEQQNAARASIQGAKGAFDAKWKTETRSYADGYYDGQITETRLEKALPVYGIQLESGYRTSDGKFPVYEGDLETASRGEVGFGIALPLLRDRVIDEPRAKIQKNELELLSAGAQTRLSQINAIREARIAYWNWVATSLQKKVIIDLVNVAEVRNTQLEAAVRAGDKPEFDLTDNSRTIFKRQSDLAKAEQIQMKAAVQLSLYYRDEMGNPVIPENDQVNDSLIHSIDVNSLNEKSLIEEALLNRPELDQLSAKEEKAKLKIKLGENLFKPRLDLKVGGYTPSGSGDKSLTENELKLGVKFEVPLELNKPRGMVAEGIAEQSSINQKTRLVKDKIATEIQKTLRSLHLAERRISAARESRVAADEVANGERIRFEQGDSNLVFVVIREQTAAEAALEEIGSMLDFHILHADLLAAIGEK